MSVLRAALSPITFGFTLFQFFSHLHDIDPALPCPALPWRQAPRNFGMALVALGVSMLALGIACHVDFLRHLRAAHARLTAAGSMAGESAGHALSMTVPVAGVLLSLGSLAISSRVFAVIRFG